MNDSPRDFLMLYVGIGEAFKIFLDKFQNGMKKIIIE